MRGWGGLWILVFLAVTGLCQGQELAVVSREEDVVVFHRLPRGEEVARVPVGPGSHEMVVVGSAAYVPSYGANTVHRIDLEAKRSHLLHSGPHSSLHGAAAAADGELLWVTAENEGSVIELSTSTGEIVRTWPTEGEQSHMVTVTSDGGTLYVANMGSGSVSVIDRTSGETSVIPTGSGAEGIDVSPDDREVWVSNRDERTLSVIDTDTDEVVATVPTRGDFPVKVRFRPGGREVWVVNNQSGTVGVFDAASRELIELVEVGERPLGLIFSGDGSQAFVTRPGVPEVVVLDGDSRSVIHRFQTGASADGMVWIP